ncbi:AAA family ATPase [Nocardia sp. NRRL WC-3656]|uniref:AAA family ATPase n=1 Tax=Nocardia sp. NRRL WC-3656 TaxID=1463824 RepID=UPI001E4B2B82|nr:AAA family ATPase [Nocardia sp. NRRL WC-3656]
MNRAPDTNGHTAESVRARGGYDAYFTPIPESAERAGAAEMTNDDMPRSASRPDAAPTSAGSAAAAAQPISPSAGGPQPATGPTGTPAPGGVAVPPTGAAFARESYGGFGDLRASGERNPAPGGSSNIGAPRPDSGTTNTTVGQQNTMSGPVANPAQAGAAQAATAAPQGSTTAPRTPTAASQTAAAPQTSAAAPQTAASQTAAPPTSTSTSATPPASTSATGAANAGTPATYASVQPDSPSATGQGTTAAWTASAEQTSWTPQPATSESRPAAWQQPQASGSQLPDRLSQAEAAARVEVLPATLTSMDLLADITAARRAQLKSTSGMRGALNKVGFSLGLSPAEQRTEDRRARIRRQLNAPYQIAVISVKGGVGRTTIAATLGSTFAGLRPDRVVAVDANPDFGDLPSRTAPHPYGLTLRDMAQAANLDAFSAVHSFTSINNADLAVLASPWSTESIEALSGREFGVAVETLRRHYNLLVVDCGTGVLDSITQMVLKTSDAIVVVTPPTVGGVKGAVATLNWLNSHGLQHLIAGSVVAIVHQQPVKPTVEVEQIEKLFATAQRPTRVVPYDEHLAEGGEIDLRLLDKTTLLAFEELAAGLGDGFPGYPGAATSGARR